TPGRVLPLNLYPDHLVVLTMGKLAGGRALLIHQRKGIAGRHDDFIILTVAGPHFYFQEAVVLAAVDQLIAVPDFRRIAMGTPVAGLGLGWQLVEGHVVGGGRVAWAPQAVSRKAHVPVMHAIDLNVLEQLIMAGEYRGHAITLEQLMVDAHRLARLAVLIAGDTGAPRRQTVDTGPEGCVVELDEDH